MTTITQITSTQAAKEATANNNFSAVSPAGALGRRPEAITGLTWAYYGGTFWANGGQRTIANGTLSMTSSSTNYVELDPEGDATNPAISANTSGFTDGRIPLYTIVTDGSGITSETDHRAAINLNPQGHDPQVIAYAATIAPDTLAGRIVQVGTLTGNLTIDPPTNPYLGAELIFLFEQDGTGSRTITWNAVFIKAADGAGAAGEKAAAYFVYDGTDWIQVGGAIAWA